MDVDQALVRKVARLARIKVSDDETEHLVEELSSILKWVEQLEEVETGDVAPMTCVENLEMKKREDEVTEGGYADLIVHNAPKKDDNFFLVPTVVE